MDTKEKGDYQPYSECTKVAAVTSSQEPKSSGEGKAGDASGATAPGARAPQASYA